MKKTLKGQLSKDLFNIIHDDGSVSYGGSQRWYSTETARKCGCGVAAAADVLIYLSSLKSGNNEYKKSQFIGLSEILMKKYLWIIPRFGVNSLWLSAGMNKYFLEHRMKYFAHWKLTGFGKWQIVTDMLKKDIPVILCIGNNFPLVFGKKRVMLYADSDKGDIRIPSTSVKSHYVVITAIDEEWLTISSWGSRYYIKRSEFDEYIRRNSAHLYCSILEIRGK